MKKILLVLSLLVLLMSKAFASGEGWDNPKNIRTYIPPRHHNTEMMKHAFERWSKVTKDRVIFVYANNPGMANLEVFFVEKIDPDIMGDKTIGLTTKRYQKDKRITHAKIYIADKSAKGKQLSEDIIFTTMLHEIGHALGLEHVDDATAIMNPYVDVVMEISDSDMEQLDEIYGK